MHDAADRGSAQACFNLSVFYFQGKGVPIDESKSREYLAKAARLGHDEAQVRLAEWEAYDKK
jgi:TPR repeat protein